MSYEDPKPGDLKMSWELGQKSPLLQLWFLKGALRNLQAQWMNLRKIEGKCEAYHHLVDKQLEVVEGLMYLYSQELQQIDKTLNPPASPDIQPV